MQIPGIIFAIIACRSGVNLSAAATSVTILFKAELFQASGKHNIHCKTQVPQIAITVKTLFLESNMTVSTSSGISIQL